MDHTTDALSLETLEDHRRLTQQVIRDLDQIRDAAGQLGLEEVEARTAAVLERAHNQVFRVAVVGEFKRGKSTLINALLGREVLPADVLPCSATLNRVTYGLTPSVTLRFKPDDQGEAREEVIGVDELEAYVTKLTPESEQRASDIEEAVVHYPVSYCRDKADIIDTPGLNDDQAMTEVTLKVLPEVDAALLVILAQSPFSAYEADFLNRLLTHDLGRVLFVVNRMDEIRRPRDRERVLKVVGDRIKKAVRERAHELHGADSPEAQAMIARLGEPRVFGVSGALALDGKLDGDQALLEQSNFPAFEAALERFLTLERGMVQLLVLADTTAAGAARVGQQVHIRRGALQLENSRFEHVFRDNEARLATLKRDYDAELRALDRAARELSDTLRPMAGRMAERLQASAAELLETYPLDAAAIQKKNVERTQERVVAAVSQRLQTVARQEAERLNREIERALEAEVQRLQGFSRDLTAALREIEFEFRPAEQPQDDDYVDFVAGGVAGVLGWGVGGAVAGAFSGYRAAGVEGAAVGGLTGVAAGFGTFMGAITLAALVGLPLTWPVTLPALALSGLAAALGSKAMVNSVFAERRIGAFREELSEAILDSLRSQARDQTRALAQALDAQVTEAFSALREQVEEELGATLRSTQRTLSELRSRRMQDGARRERALEELDRLEARLHGIEARSLALIDQLRAVEEA